MFRIGAGVVVAFYRVKGDAIVVDELCSIVDDVFMNRDGIRCQLVAARSVAGVWIKCMDVSERSSGRSACVPCFHAICAEGACDSLDDFGVFFGFRRSYIYLFITFLP